jgi:ElaB/YqjD/DUF883 family membrane-anchored ribosome-binding protein
MLIQSRLIGECEMNVRDNLLSNLRALLEETEHLIHEVSDQSESRIVWARDSARQAVDRAQRDLRHYAHTGFNRARDAGVATDRYAHEHAWSFIAGAALVALLIGSVLASHGKRNAGEDESTH